MRGVTFRVKRKNLMLNTIWKGFNSPFEPLMWLILSYFYTFFRFYGLKIYFDKSEYIASVMNTKNI
jgi:hypothetical protein